MLLPRLSQDDCILECRDLAFSYGKRKLFQQLSFTVESGRILQLCGQNGVGKSTLLAILAGLLSGSQGSIQLIDAERGAVLDERLHHTEYLPAEGNGFFQTLSAHENLRFWSELRPQTSEDQQRKVDLALTEWGLAVSSPHLRLPVAKFSTGMRRRLALAKLSLSPAALWLLDEPFYGLDQIGGQKFLDLLQAHVKRGGLAVMVTHDLSHVGSLAMQKVFL